MRRGGLTILAALLLVGCGEQAVEDPPDKERPPEQPVEQCLEGELEVGAHCIAPGVDVCVDGFVADGEGGCVAVLPTEPCAPGTMAIPGETACREVAPCPSGDFADPIPPGALMVHPTAGPYTTISDAIAAASSGDTIAISAGSYAERIVISGKSLTLWGACPAQVIISGDGNSISTVLVQGQAHNTTLRALTVTGNNMGIAVSGASDVVIDQVIVQDTGGRGINLEDTFGPASAFIRDSLIENASGLGVFGLGAIFTVERSVVRHTRLGSASGRGVAAQGGSEMWMTDSVIHDNVEHNIYVSGSGADIATTVVHGTAQQVGLIGGGISIQTSNGDFVPSHAAVRDSVIARGANLGIVVEGSTGWFERVTVRDSQPAPPIDGSAVTDFGAGFQIQNTRGAGALSNATIVSSLITNSRYAGVSVTGAEALLRSSIVRNTAPTFAGSYGRGVIAFFDEDEGHGVNMTITDSLIENNVEAGVSTHGAALTLERSIVRNTAPNGAGNFGRGLSIQGIDATATPSWLSLTSSLIDNNHDLGIHMDNSTATMFELIVAGTKPRPSDGLFGDGLHINAPSMQFPAEAVIDSATVRDNARVGVASFGALVTLSSSELECNIIALNGQNSQLPFEIRDGGGNSCGCEDTESQCKILSEKIAPPEPVYQ